MHPLTALHQELRQLIGQLAAETAKPAADMSTVTAIRMKLTQASRRRATLIEEAMLEARRSETREDHAALERVVMSLREARLASGTHIGKWTVRAIESDWQGYCRDSANVRSSMLRQLDLEASVLKTWLSRRV